MKKPSKYLNKGFAIYNLDKCDYKYFGLVHQDHCLIRLYEPSNHKVFLYDKSLKRKAKEWWPVLFDLPLGVWDEDSYDLS